MTARALIAFMAALQVWWVTLVWWSRAAPHTEKLLPILLYSVLATVTVDRLPETVLDGLRKVGRTLTQGEARLWVLASLLFLCAGGMYAYNFYGWPDEPLVFAAAKIVAGQGVGPFFHDYLDIPWLGRQHPPLAVLFYGFALRIGGEELFVIRLTSVFFALVTLGLTYQIGKEVSTRTVGLAATAWLFCMPFFFRLASAALTDIPVTCCFVLAIFLSLRLSKNPSLWLATLIGITIGVGLLCKYTMVFVYPVILMAGVYGGRFRRLWLPFTVAVLVSFAIFSLWLAYAVQEGIFAGQLSTLSGYARSVTGTRTGKRWLLSVFTFRLPSGVGVANLPVLAVGMWQMLRRRQRSDYFFGGWILAVAAPLALTLPGPRYFFPMFPALAVVMALGLRQVEADVERVLLLAFLFACASLYLFVDWPQAAGGLFRR